MTDGIGINVNKFLTDLKRVLIVINSSKQVFMLKDKDAKTKTGQFGFLNLREFQARMAQINVGKYWKDGKIREATALDIYKRGKNKNFFLRDALSFHSDDPNDYSLFYGYPFKTLSTYDESIIKPFLDHTREVIANNDNKVYEYIINWCSWIIQHITGKTATVLVLTGAQGAGKTWFTDTFCELFGNYATKNITNIDHITGKFNSARMNKKVIVINEVDVADGSKPFNPASMKSAISDDSFQIERKGVDSVSCQAVDNFIICSNEFMPIKMEGDDRRYVVCEVNPKYKDDKQHFKRLFELRTKKFYENLLTFFMTRDLTEFIPAEIPLTKAKKQIQQASENSAISFIREFHEYFVAEGWSTKDCYAEYQQYCKDNSFKPFASTTFGTKANRYIENKQVRLNGARERRYFLKPGIKFDDGDEEIIDLDATSNII